MLGKIEDKTNDTVFCPVMRGIPVNKQDAAVAGMVRKHNGKKYYLCCQVCVESFDSDPANYEGKDIPV